MFKKTLLAMSALSMVAVPAAADAHRYHGYNNGYYSDGYYAQRGYDNGYYNRGYSDNGYGQRAYSNGYYGNAYGYRTHRCSGTTETIVGAGAGALLGRALGRAGNDGYSHHSGTTGTILGAAVGGLLGRSVGKSTC